MTSWPLIALLGVGLAFLLGRTGSRRAQQNAAAAAAGLQAVADLSHLPSALQRSALWCLSDGGFERRVVHGVVTRNAHEIDITAFDLETLRERRGEWAYLPVDQPFRIAGTVSAVVCEVDFAFPHVLFKRAGSGDELTDDNHIERLGHLAKNMRDRLGVSRSYAAELPPSLPEAAIESAVPDQWRAYSRDADAVKRWLETGFARTLTEHGRRDLVVELIDGLVIIYPAARDVVGSDAFADLTSTALAIVDGILACTPSLSPRGVESVRA
ncbi:MAG: hypothetical protein AB7O24_05270 [Kofleriaceae bacterium]